MNTEPAKATKTISAFRMGCAVNIAIDASPEQVWALLTDAAGFPRWNSTVTQIEGEIAEGNTLRLKVKAAPGRVFKPKISKVERARSMTWSEGMAPMFKGVRKFTLTPLGHGATQFSMQEELSGLMLPMIRASLPDFAPVFEAYARDLKRAAEGRAQ